MAANEQVDEHGKTTTITLDCGANPSFIRTGTQIPTKLTRITQVNTPKGPFQTNKVATLTLKTKIKTANSKALVHDKLHQNLLSTTPIVENLGAVVLDTKGAALIPSKVYDNIKRELNYFGNRRNKLYQVPMTNGEICLGAQEETGNKNKSRKQKSQKKGEARRETMLRKA